jgi:MFS family permease
MEKYLKGGFFKMFLAFAFLNDFGMFYSLYNYIFSQSGMSVFQVSTILSCGQIGKIIFDIPGGILNDKYNKKFAFYIGIFAKILAMIIFINFKNYYTFIIAMFLVGISWSCTFGKLETFLYSQLEVKENFTKQIGVMYGLVNLSIAIASYITSKIYNTEVILYMQIGVYLVALLVLFLMQIQRHDLQNQKNQHTENKDKFSKKNTILLTAN